MMVIIMIVYHTYKNLYERFPEQKVEGRIRSVLSKYKKQSESGSRTRVINVALRNCDSTTNISFCVL